MSRSTIRRVFVGAFLVLVIQYGLVGLVGVHSSEPWPTVVLPGFKTVYGTEDTIHIDRPQLDVAFEDGGRASASTAQFLSPIPRSHHPSFLEAQCRPSSISATDRTEQCRAPEGQRWFLHQADQLFAPRSVAAVDIVWSHLRFVPDRQTVHHTPIDTLRLTAPRP